MSDTLKREANSRPIKAPQRCSIENSSIATARSFYIRFPYASDEVLQNVIGLKNPDSIQIIGLTTPWRKKFRTLSLG